MIGAKQQVLLGGQGMNGGSTKGNGRRSCFAAHKTSRLRMRTATLPRSDLPIAEARVNLIRHGSDEQMIGAKQQVLLGGQDD